MRSGGPGRILPFGQDDNGECGRYSYCLVPLIPDYSNSGDAPSIRVRWLI